LFQTILSQADRRSIGIWSKSLLINRVSTMIVVNTMANGGNGERRWRITLICVDSLTGAIDGRNRTKAGKGKESGCRGCDERWIAVNRGEPVIGTAPHPRWDLWKQGGIGGKGKSVRKQHMEVFE